METPLPIIGGPSAIGAIKAWRFVGKDSPFEFYAQPLPALMAPGGGFQAQFAELLLADLIKSEAGAAPSLYAPRYFALNARIVWHKDCSRAVRRFNMDLIDAAMAALCELGAPPLPIAYTVWRGLKNDQMTLEERQVAELQDVATRHEFAMAAAAEFNVADLATKFLFVAIKRACCWAFSPGPASQHNAVRESIGDAIRVKAMAIRSSRAAIGPDLGSIEANYAALFRTADSSLVYRMREEAKPKTPEPVGGGLTTNETRH